MPSNTNQIPRNDRRTRFFSPDSQWIGFFVRGTLRKLLVAGGAPVTVAAAPGIFLGADWGKDDTIVYAGMAASGNSSLWRVSAEGGTAAEIRQESFERGGGAPARPSSMSPTPNRSQLHDPNSMRSAN